LYITSQGKSDKAAAAAKVVVNVLIGIAIVLLAKGIVNLTYRVLTGSSLEQNTAPTKQLTPVSTINLLPFP
jgi:flagellar basal body-associated protein FliL